MQAVLLHSFTTLCPHFVFNSMSQILHRNIYGEEQCSLVGCAGGGWKAGVGAGCMRYMSCSRVATDTSPTVSRNRSNSMERARTARSDGSKSNRRPNLEI